MTQVLLWTRLVFESAWRILTGWDFFGLNPAEILFASFLIMFVIRNIIKPTFGEKGGGGKDD